MKKNSITAVKVIMFSSLIFVIPLELYLLYFELMGMPSTEKLMKILHIPFTYDQILYASYIIDTICIASFVAWVKLDDKLHLKIADKIGKLPYKSMHVIHTVSVIIMCVSLVTFVVCYLLSHHKESGVNTVLEEILKVLHIPIAGKQTTLIGFISLAIGVILYVILYL